MLLEKLSKNSDVLYLISRILVGFFFFIHGLGKFMPNFIGPGNISGFAGFIGMPVAVAALVGIGEILVGLGILTGFFARLSALGGIVIMLGAIVLAHTAKFTNWNFFSNGAELPLIYIAAFLLILVHGNGKWSLEQAVMKKETF